MTPKETFYGNPELFLGLDVKIERLEALIRVKVN
jgi:hypothetical protein